MKGKVPLKGIRKNANIKTSNITTIADANFAEKVAKTQGNFYATQTGMNQPKQAKSVSHRGQTSYESGRRLPKTSHATHRQVA